MKRKINQTAEEIKLYVFVIFLAELFLFGVSLVGGRFLGYRTSLLIGAGAGIIVAAIFVILLAGNVLMIAALKLMEKLTRKRI